MKTQLKKRLLWGLLALALIFLPLPGCGLRQGDPVHAPLSAGVSASVAPAGIRHSDESASQSDDGASPAEAQRVIVYVTETGGKYHCSGCSYLAKSCIAIELETAKQRYGPCSKCRPPA